jgi:thioredoxin 1
MTQITELGTADFKAQVIAADRPVLVDFYADWCGPCQAQAPILDNIARSVGAAARVVKVNIDRAPELADLFAVRSIPTLMIFKNGTITDRFTGITSGQKIAAALMAQID